MAAGVPDKYRSLLSSLSPSAYADADGRILAENDAFRALRAADASAPDAFTLPMLFAEGDADAVRDLLVSLTERTRRASRAMTIAGSTVPVLGEFVPVARKSGGGMFWQVTLSPIRQPAAQAPEPASQLTSRAAVTAGIIHDLRTPVQVVLGWASLLRRKHDDPERIVHALSIIERNAELMIELLQDLLEETRPAWTRAPLQSGVVDLAELVKGEVRAMQPIADESGVRMRVAVTGRGVVVPGDEVRLRRVVINLLGNALKFTPRDGDVECRVWRTGRWAALTVRDTGPGIARELLPSVFDPFVQGSGERPPAEGGIGLGLTVVRQLVEEHGGRVTAANSSTGSGATFTVLLPAAMTTSQRTAPYRMSLHRSIASDRPRDAARSGH